MTLWVYAAGVAIGALIGFGGGWAKGYLDGVKDTERRWTDAVRGR